MAPPDASLVFDFSDFIADRTKDFTGRAWVFAELDRWLADPELDFPHWRRND